MTLPPDRSHLGTEGRNPRSVELHRASLAECVALIQDEDRHVHEAVAAARPALIAFLEAAAPGFLAGGRMVYLGAGTSGRLGVLDASEAPPTFQVAPDRIIGLIAGGDRALRQSSEGREDEPEAFIPELAALGLSADDTLLGIAAGGTTPCVLGALAWAAHQPAPPLRAFLTCTQVTTPPSVEHHIVCDTGAEVLTGSTRLKAGTATKLMLNTLSTTLMVRAGKVHSNLMVDVRATNDKLRDRAARILSDLLGLERPRAFELLAAAGGSVKVAAVMHVRDLTREAAEETLASTGGGLAAALEPDAPDGFHPPALSRRRTEPAWPADH